MAASAVSVPIVIVLSLGLQRSPVIWSTKAALGGPLAIFELRELSPLGDTPQSAE